MTTSAFDFLHSSRSVVEAYRLDRYDNFDLDFSVLYFQVVEAYRLDRYDNPKRYRLNYALFVVEAYRLDRYDNSCLKQKSPHCFLNLQYGDSCFCLKMFVN